MIYRTILGLVAFTACTVDAHMAADVAGVDGALAGSSATRNLLVRRVPDDEPGDEGVRDDGAGPAHPPRSDDAEGPARIEHPKFAAGPDGSFNPELEYPILKRPGSVAGPAGAGPVMGPRHGGAEGPTGAGPMLGPRHGGAEGPTGAGPMMGPRPGGAAGPVGDGPMMGPRFIGAAGPAGAGPMMGPAEAPGPAGFRGGRCADGNLTLMDLIDDSSELDIFAMMVENGRMVPALESLEGVTVFVPSFEAFMDLPEETYLEMMEDLDPTMLQELIGLHMVEGKFLYEDLEDGDQLETLTGVTLEIVMDPKGNKILQTPSGVVATITEGDVEACNGMLHIIDTVLVPGMKSDTAEAPGAEPLARRRRHDDQGEDSEEVPDHSTTKPPRDDAAAPAGGPHTTKPPRGDAAAPAGGPSNHGPSNDRPRADAPLDAPPRRREPGQGPAEAPAEGPSSGRAEAVVSAPLLRRLRPRYPHTEEHGEDYSHYDDGHDDGFEDEPIVHVSTSHSGSPRTAEASASVVVTSGGSAGAFVGEPLLRRTRDDAPAEGPAGGERKPSMGDGAPTGGPRMHPMGDGAPNGGPRNADSPAGGPRPTKPLADAPEGGPAGAVGGAPPRRPRSGQAPTEA